MSRKAPSAISPRIFWSASFLFLISGATGLAYQVIWFKRFSHVWGSTSLAFAAVGGSFLFGLGLGAYLFGRLADTIKVPLKWYGACELLIGLLALVIPFEIAFLVEASVGLYAYIPQQPILRFLVQFCITLLVIGPPCALMGGTLPQLIRQLTAREGSLDQATGWLYAVNTFGAALGCYLAGFHLIPALGLMWMNNLTAAVNITIGVVSLLLSRTLAAPSESPATATQPAPSRMRWSLALAGLYLATVLTGCASLVLEMTWTRQLSLILGGSTYALTATLFVVLVGIALGSLLFHGLLRGIASWPLLPVVVIGVLVASVLAGKMAIPALSLRMGLPGVAHSRAEPAGNAVVCVAASAALEFVPALAMGVLFPLLIHLTRASAARVGAAVGNIYAWNTLGSILGASLTSLLLFPWIGTYGSMTLAAGFYLVSALLVVPWQPMRNALIVSAAGALGVVALVALARPIDPRLTNMGFYMYTSKGVDSSDGKWMAALTPRYFREGASSNVFVTQGADKAISLRVNGKVDASNSTDMSTQIGLAYFPRVFKHDAKEVLVIGFGSGCTSGRSLQFPETRVTCCEIEPAVYEAAGQFAADNFTPQHQTRQWLTARNDELPPEQRKTADEIAREARFSIMFADGRTAVQSGGKKYDLIISEPSNPWLAGVSNLFTQEFFRSAREHLTDDGVLAQWIQTYNFTISDYLMIVRTLKSEFPHFGVLVLLGGIDTVLVASQKPLLPDAESIAALQKVVDANPSIHGDLQHWFGGTDLRWLLLTHYRLGEDQLLGLLDQSHSQDINTDLHLRLEFDAPLRLFRDLKPAETAIYRLTKAASPKWTSHLAHSLGVDADTVEGHVTLGEYMVGELENPKLYVPLTTLGRLDEAAAQFEKAIALDPDCLAAHRELATIRRRQGRADDVIAELNTVIRLSPKDASAHAELAQEYSLRKQPQRAIAEYRAALRLQPELSLGSQNYMWANNLAWILATNPDDAVRNGAEAVRLASDVCKLHDYKQPETLDTLAVAYAEQGNFDQAIKTSELVISLAANNPQLVETNKTRINLYRSSQPFREQ